MGKQYGEKILGQILAEQKKGVSIRQIGEQLGYSQKQIKNVLERHRRKERKRAAGIEIRPKGWPRMKEATPEQRIRELEMEVVLLRSFLQAAGGK